MLIRFVVANYLSFKDETEFNMLTGSPRRLKEHVYHIDSLELLKTAAIYGANGAGKSNLVKAVSLLQQIVLTGEWDPVSDIRPFRLQADYANRPTHLEVEFVSKEQSYSYGLTLQGSTIIEEWLYQTQVHENDVRVFDRTTKAGETEIQVNEKYFQSESDKVRIQLYEQELLPDNMPLLKMMAEAKEVFPEIRAAYGWFLSHLTIVFPHSKPIGFADWFTRSPAIGKFTNELMASLQTGIAKLEVETIDLDQFFGEDDKDMADKIKMDLKDPKQRISLRSDSKREEILAMREEGKPVIKRIVTQHCGADGVFFDFSAEEESDGTLRLFELIPAFYQALISGSTIIIDEVGQSIHPYLLKKLIEKFVADPETNGQVIFTTHESHLLDQDIFRQDEIWFVEKKPSGESTLYPLSDYDIRYDLDIRKGYLNGRFGAIPFLANLKDLNWNMYAPEEQSV